MSYSSEEKSKYVEMVRCGASFHEAAREFGASDMSVKKWCDAAGVMSAYIKNTDDEMNDATWVKHTVKNKWGKIYLKGRQIERGNLEERRRVQKEKAEKCKRCVWAKHSFNKVNCFWGRCEMSKTHTVKKAGCQRKNGKAE